MKTVIKPRLVALDIDGTLIGRDLIVHPRVVEAIAQMQRRGVRGALVTGRMYRSALPYARRLKLDAPVVCYQGAAVIDPGSDDVLLDVPLRNPEVLALVEYARREGLHLQLYKNDRFYCERLNDWAKLYASIAGVAPVIVPSLGDEFAASDATKAVFVAPPDIAEAHLPRIAALLGDRAYVTRSLPEFVEVMNANVDKGKALAIAAGYLGIEMEHVLAIGDSWNDAPLLRAAGFGVAMGSAPPELRAAADAIVADVANDGVAEAIERFVLS